MTAIPSFRRLLLLCTVACSAYSVKESPRCESAGNDGSHQLRLVGLNSTMAGHVEVCTSEGVWSKLLISDVGLWSRKNSIVVCSELGYLNALHVTNFNERYILKSTSSGDTSPYRGYHSIQCSGLEETLLDCKTRGWNASEKTPSTLQWPLVVCVKAPGKGDIRLVGIGPDNQGVVQVYHPNRIYRWSTVCTNKWDDSDARVACKQLGYQSGKSVLHKGNQNSLPRKRYDNYVCNGSESSLAECSFDGPYPLRCFSADNQYAGVECQENDRDSKAIGIADPRISLLVLITGVILLLITVIGMLLRCTVKRFRRKRSPLPLTSRDSRSSTGQRLPRVTLSSGYWQQNGAYNNITADAPPTYEETVSVVQSNDNLIETDIDTHETDIDTHETDIDTLETDNDTHDRRE